MLKKGGRLYIVHVITCLGDGGAESVLFRLCSHDTDNRHVVVSLRGSGKYGPLLARSGISVHCLEMPKGRLTFRGIFRLWKLLRSEHPDVVQTWMYHADLVGGVVARLVGIRRVFWGIRHSDLSPEKTRRSTMLVAKICARLSRWVPFGIICCAQKALEAHKALGYASHKMRVIPNGFDLNTFQPDTQARTRLRSEFGVANELPLLGMVGRFDPLKDHENLFRALALLKQGGNDFRCVLAGAGVDRGNALLIEVLKDLGLQDEVLLLGPRTDIPAFMNALDVHVLSSCSEAFPNVLAEAMACGTPCVTTDVGDAAVIVGDAGWIVPPSNSRALADALGEALNSLSHAENWACLQKKARQRIAENFQIATMVERFNNVWNSEDFESFMDVNL